jgi:hypothetical protein
MRKSLLLGTIALFALNACGPAPIDPRRQIGAHPYLPKIHQYLLPPMHVPKNVGWGSDAPKAVAGLKVAAFARNLKNPRSIYVLPNGDVLVAETDGPPAPVNRPKEFVMNWIEAQAHSSVKAGNRILLLRDTNGDGTPDQQWVFLDHLHSPFGMVLVGSDFYVADTDGVLHYPYQDGETQITAPGNTLTPLPGGPIDHHWTKSLTAGPDGSKLYAGVGSNSNITENGIGAELDRAAVWEIDRATGAHRLYATGLRNPNGLSFEPRTHKLWVVVNERDELGPDLVPDYMTSVKDGAFYGWPYSYYGQPCRAAGYGVLCWQQSSCFLSRRCLCRRAWQLGSHGTEWLQGRVHSLHQRYAQRNAAGYSHRLCRRRCGTRPPGRIGNR